MCSALLAGWIGAGVDDGLWLVLFTPMQNDWTKAPGSPGMSNWLCTSECLSLAILYLNKFLRPSSSLSWLHVTVSTDLWK